MSDDRLDEIKNRDQWGFEDADKTWLIGEVERLRVGDTALRVTPQEIVEQRAEGWPDFHPERYCHKCGQVNVWSWSVDDALWDEVVDFTIDGVEPILCPQCFTEAYALKHPVTTWRLVLDDGRVADTAREAEKVMILTRIDRAIQALEAGDCDCDREDVIEMLWPADKSAAAAALQEPQT